MTDIYLTREQVRRIDQRAIDEYAMMGLVLMENAGRGCVDVLCRLGIAGQVVVCCGKGNNGGDGFVIARHLDLRGYETRVLLCCEPDSLQGDAAANYEILSRAGVPLLPCPEDYDDAWLARQLKDAAWIVDALLGTGARGEPRPPLDRLIPALNAHPARRLAIDLPSGLDCDTGQAAAAAIQADCTCTFVAAKAGFRVASAQPYLGQVHVLDIGAPRKLLRDAGVS